MEPCDQNVLWAELQQIRRNNSASQFFLCCSIILLRFFILVIFYCQYKLCRRFFCFNFTKNICRPRVQNSPRTLRLSPLPGLPLLSTRAPDDMVTSLAQLTRYQGSKVDITRYQGNKVDKALHSSLHTTVFSSSFRGVIWQKKNLS